MNKKVVSKSLSLAFATSLALSSVPADYYGFLTVNAAPIQKETIYADGITDAWKQDEATIKGEGAVCAVENGWLHLKSDPANGNNPGTNPAMFVNPNTFDFNADGFFSFTMKSNNENSAVDNSDRFGVYLGYNTESNGMFVGYDNSGWFWQKYINGGGEWYSGGRHAAPKKNAEVEVLIKWTADHKMTLQLDGETVFTDEDFSGIADVLGSQIAFKCGSWGNAPSDVLVKEIHYAGQAEAASYAVSGIILDADGNPVESAEVKLGESTATTDAEGKYAFSSVYEGTHEIVVSKDGFQTVTSTVDVNGSDLTVDTITLVAAEKLDTEVLSTADMDVYVSKTFPSVEKYEMKGDLAGKTFLGQTSVINTVKINNTAVELSKEDVAVEFSDNKAVYTMTVKGEKIDAVITAELVAEKNTLAFNITDIKNNLEDKVGGDPIQTIEIPNHSLVSVHSSQEGANLKGAAMSSVTTTSGDEYVEVTETTPIRDRDYMYAFVSNEELSAGLWSNSEHDGRAASPVVAGGSTNTRVMSTTEAKDGGVSMGLGSCAWYYHRVVTDSHNRTYMIKETAMPQTKVIITGDQNDDSQIDWQDGAVAFRSIMNNPYKSEEVPELVAYRIAMNFGGQAQNPFLTSLDNVKRVAMHTDGLGQSVLLKGYANEGHDSGHPDYADIGQRIGGTEDMNTLMTKGAEYGARFGIHVNAGEFYPEAKAFKDDNVRRDAAGNLRYGWNWIDQGVALDSVYDLATGEREARFDALEEKVGQNLDFVYVDIWGNQTGGSDDSWQTRKLSKEINDNGWRMANEWGAANEYDATFQHWATDLTYGGASMKGENSEVMRFLRNHQKDSWVGDYPAYGGAANMPLLGGYNMKDFEGWQGRNDYDTYITNLYTHDLTTKFIQHYKAVKWVDGEPVNGWTPEMEITLKDDDGATLVLTRGSNNPSDAGYRERTMTLDGKVIAQGAPSRGDRSNADIQNGNKKGTESYLLPWIWDAKTGKKVSSADEKLYHWNTQGGTTTWDLPESWAGLANVKVYKLTDLGKTDEKTVAVSNGKITLEAESEIPYVVCKGAESNLNITWSEGMHIVDAGFNSGKENVLTLWNKTGDGDATISKSQFSNPMLKLSGEVAMTQKLTDLKAGQQYAVLVGVDNRSDSKASVTVKSGDKVLADNYTERSIAKNYVKAYTHSNASATVDGTSYFQNMYVFFTAPESGEVTLTLAKTAGEGDAYFDDIRVTENESKNITRNDKGEIVKFEQDYENIVQGLYPFVVGGIEGVEDNRIHLSELHAPYTQAGWDVKKMDDVLDGNWSVKINNLDGANTLAFQTIPQNFRFEPGVEYKVSFDYQSGSENIYGVVIGDGEYKGASSVDKLPMAMGADADGHYETTVTGSTSGQTWFGIYSTEDPADLQGTSGAAAQFGGYMGFVLDNLVIEKVEVEYTAEALKTLIEKAAAFNEADYSAADWAKFENALVAARVVLEKETPATDEDIETAYKGLKIALQELKSAAGPEADTTKDIAVDAYTVSAGSAQPATGSEGPVEFAQDNDPGSHWHTLWGDTNLDNAWYEFTFAEPAAVDGMRYLPRSGAANANGKLLNVKILVKVDGEDEYRTVLENAELDPITKWQIIRFDNAIENVTNVKLVALETAGQTANQANCFASAAELRVTKPVSSAEKVDKTGLQAAIDVAKALKKADYTAESWEKVSEKLTVAEKVMTDTNADLYAVTLAKENLNDAVKALVKAEEPAEQITKTQLKSLLKDADNLDASKYTGSTWNKIPKATKSAQKTYDNKKATPQQIEKAYNDLKKAIDGLEKKPQKNKK